MMFLFFNQRYMVHGSECTTLRLMLFATIKPQKIKTIKGSRKSFKNVINLFEIKTEASRTEIQSAQKLKYCRPTKQPLHNVKKQCKTKFLGLTVFEYPLPIFSIETHAFCKLFQISEIAISFKFNLQG